MCGFIGMIQPGGSPVFGDIFDGLTAIQHRGQDAAGIITFDGRFHIKKGAGLVREVFSDKHVDRLTGSVGLGHVRYPTVGDGSAEDAQPFLLNSPFGIAMVHNGNLTNCSELLDRLWSEGHRHVNSTCDVEIILNVFAESLSKQPMIDGEPTDEGIFNAVREVFSIAKGAYSVVASIGGDRLVAFRDPFGIKPIIMGERETAAGKGFCFASESVVLDLLDFHNTRNLAPAKR